MLMPNISDSILRFSISNKMFLCFCMLIVERLLSQVERKF